ncbi:integral membrane protein [Colletotrichum tofieldiae]|nr:integral membrane protein [Colletotrichum tofieldiae]
MTSSIGPTGAAPPPPGETPNFDNPRDAGYRLHTVYMSLIQAIVVFFFALRVYVKLRWIYISSLLYSPAAFFTKVSLLLLTVRVFSVDTKVARALHGLLVFFLLCYIPAEVAKAAVCIPVQAFWDPSIPNLKCINQTKLFLYDGAISMFSDLVILVVPVVLTWRLRVSTVKKVKIVGLLGAGGVAFAVTIYRTVLVVRFQNSMDPSVDFVPVDWTTTTYRQQRVVQQFQNAANMVERSLQKVYQFYVVLGHRPGVQGADWEENEAAKRRLDRCACCYA